MKIKHYQFLLLFMFVVFAYQESVASRWPVFITPTKNFLQENNAVDTQSCPSGYGRIKQPLKLNIKNFFCKTYCPDNWYWLSEKSDRCFNLSTDFDLLRIEITRYKDDNDGDDGTVKYSKVDAIYGNTRTGQQTFKFVFKTSQDHWFCIEQNGNLGSITCANDM